MERMYWLYNAAKFDRITQSQFRFQFILAAQFEELPSFSEMENAGWKDFKVKSFDPVMVTPCIPLPKTVLQLSSVDNLPLIRGYIFNSLIVYNACERISADPVKVIREALSKVLVYYFPFAGRLRYKENGDLEVDCNGEGALFVEAMVDCNLSVLGDLDDRNPSYGDLHFALPPNTDIVDLHPLVVQVTRFACGGFVVGVSFQHSLCDGRGAGQFLQGLAEIARGEDKLSCEPIWNRELLKPEDPIHLQYYHLYSLRPSEPTIEEWVHASLVINAQTIKCMKQSIMEECNEVCSSFEIVAALAWRARTKALQIPQTQNVKLLIPMDMRKSFNPPFPKGYYGNAIGLACAMDNARDLVNGSLLRAINIIRKSKAFLIEQGSKSRVTVNPSVSDVNSAQENVVILSDWRRLGFNEADFGWGDAVNVTPVQTVTNGLVTMPNYFLFLRPSEDMLDGIKILMCVASSMVKSLKFEVEDMINKYVTTV
ncbi:hypothetical protein KI387_030974 [Taxus chinensis]|uniref:Uncharacterized protein n=1 Tax=Taxus chinensis TaxID=29808 RepID=A0AA38FF01_TAXCH|nr:hypothetical protein KI387_030974 [Taxus chinensis]